MNKNKSKPNTRRQIVAEILSSAQVEASLEALAAKESQPLISVKKRAKRGLSSLVAVHKPIFNKVFNRILGPMHTSAWTRDVDAASLARLEELSKDNMLVFLPTHRSYADPFILSDIISKSKLPGNYILGGDNIGFWPMGSIVRRSGAILIRRKFGNDQVYKMMIREYLGYLARNGSNLEWYMEGGRSRTGKLRPPMYGLLRYLGQALSAERVKSVILVPVSITYDQLHEIHAMVEEEKGQGDKQKEGIGWLANYARMQSEWIGTAYVRFGEPLSLTDALAHEAGNSWVIEKIAIEVFQRINRVTPVTGPALATLALLAVRNRALRMPEITGLVTPLLAYARQRKLPTEVVDELDNHSGITASLKSLVNAGVVDCYSEGLEPVYNIRTGSHNIAAFYRNTAIHWFVNRAVLEVALSQTVNQGLVGDELFEFGWSKIHELRDLLKFEFFFSEKAEFKEEVRAEANVLDEEFFKKLSAPGERRDMLATAPILVAHRVLTPFLEAYLIVGECLLAMGSESVDDTGVFIKDCLRIGHQYVLQHRVSAPECVSQELFKNAVKIAENRNLLVSREGIEKDRFEILEYLRDIVKAVAEVEKIDSQRSVVIEGEVFHV